jgi:hypothetical protein
MNEGEEIPYYLRDVSDAGLRGEDGIIDVNLMICRERLSRRR